MAAKLQCEICGGMLIGRPGGIFECDSCGMKYDTAWAKAKIQEIRGTVQVEGTVEVTGKVQVDGPVKVEGKATADSLARRGNMLLADRKWDEAKETFGKALEIEPENAEANLGFFLAKEKKQKREYMAGDYVKSSFIRSNINLTTARKHATGELKAWFDSLDAKAAEHDREESNAANRFSGYQKALTNSLSLNPSSLDSALKFFTDNSSYFRCPEARLLCDKKTGLADAAREYTARIKTCGDELSSLSKRQQKLKEELSALGLFGNREKKSAVRGELKTVNEQCALKEKELLSLKEKAPKIDEFDRDLNALRVMAESNSYGFRYEPKNPRIIELGRYPQGPNGEPAPIRWIAYQKIYSTQHKEEGAVLICESVLDRLPDLTKEAKSHEMWYVLEKWLNSEFKNKAFTAVEQSILYELTVPKKRATDENINPFSPIFDAKSTDYLTRRGVSGSLAGTPCWYIYDSCYDSYASGRHINRYDLKGAEVTVGIRPVIHVKGMKP